MGQPEGGGTNTYGRVKVAASRCRRRLNGRRLVEVGEGDGGMGGRRGGYSKQGVMGPVVHLPASKGRGCPGKPGSVTPLPLPSRTFCSLSFPRAAPSFRLFPAQAGRRACGCGVRRECATVCAAATRALSRDPSLAFFPNEGFTAKKPTRVNRAACAIRGTPGTGRMAFCCQRETVRRETSASEPSHESRRKIKSHKTTKARETRETRAGRMCPPTERPPSTPTCARRLTRR